MKLPKDAYIVSKILLIVDFVLMFLYLPLGLIIYSDAMRVIVMPCGNMPFRDGPEKVPLLS